jgi:ribose transport system permease protein
MTIDQAAPPRPLTPAPAAPLHSRVIAALCNYAVVLLLAIVVVALAVASPSFFGFTNLTNLTGQWAAVGVLATVATIVIISGGFDMSLGATYAFCMVTAAGVAIHHSAVVAYLAALGVGLAVGLVNGVVVQGIGLNPFVATLGTSFIVTGVGFAVTDAKPYYLYSGKFDYIGTNQTYWIPNAGWVLILLMLAAGLLLWRTVYGRSVYAVGGNKEAARLAGINVGRIVVSTYVLSGLGAAVAGCLTASRLGAGQMTTDISILFSAITVVLIGGTSLAGGSGAMWRTAVGLAILACLGNGFNQLDLSTYLQNIITGCIVLLALSLDRVLLRTRGTKGAEL